MRRLSLFLSQLAVEKKNSISRPLPAPASPHSRNHADSAFRVTIAREGCANGFNEPLFLNRGAIATPKSRLAMANRPLSVLYLSHSPPRGGLRARGAFCIHARVTRPLGRDDGVGACSCVPGTDCASGPRTLFDSHAPKQTPSDRLPHPPFHFPLSLSLFFTLFLPLLSLRFRVPSRAFLSGRRARARVQDFRKSRTEKIRGAYRAVSKSIPRNFIFCQGRDETYRWPARIHRGRGV